MKVFVSVDMEGISGLVRWADVVTQGVDYATNRRIMTREANAAIDGAFAAGAREVVVEENHGVEDLCNLLTEEIDARCTLIRGAGRPGATTMAGLDADTSCALLIGHHARAGSFPGIMAHTVSYNRFRRVRVNGRDCGEPEIFAIRAGELGVPIALIAGDQIACQQLADRSPRIEQVCVKEALSNQAARVRPPAHTWPEIRAGSERAVRRAAKGEFEPYRGEPAPYTIEVDMREPLEDSLRANLERLDEFEVTGERTIRTAAEDMDIGFRRIAYLGYADRPGVVRY